MSVLSCAVGKRLLGGIIAGIFILGLTFGLLVGSYTLRPTSTVVPVNSTQLTPPASCMGPNLNLRPNCVIMV
jgi:hypothetical protein